MLDMDERYTRLCVESGRFAWYRYPAVEWYVHRSHPQVFTLLFRPAHHLESMRTLMTWCARSGWYEMGDEILPGDVAGFTGRLGPAIAEGLREQFRTWH